jgi:hypothetical protein
VSQKIIAKSNVIGFSWRLPFAPLQGSTSTWLFTLESSDMATALPRPDTSFLFENVMSIFDNFFFITYEWSKIS